MSQICTPLPALRPAPTFALHPAARGFLVAGVLTLSVGACAEGPIGPGIELQWVAIEGGCFTLGDRGRYPEEGPAREACVDPFEISAHEITNAQFAAFVDATGYTTRAERGWAAGEAGGPGIAVAPGSVVFVPPSGTSAPSMSWWRMTDGASWRRPAGSTNRTRPEDSHPVVHITREDAEAYAAWAGGRLPSEAEWEFAARAVPGGEVSQWADVDYIDGGDKANTWQGVFPVRNTNEDSFAGIAPVGSFRANAFGLYDMIGNVWEWTATPYAPSHSDADRAAAGTNGFAPNQPGASVGVIKGGSYLCADNYCARFRPAARQAQDLGLSTSHIGFRIARTPQESPAQKGAPQSASSTPSDQAQ